MYCVCDPFDGSYLFKRGIPDFWYSSLAFYSEDFTPACCAVGDGVQRKIAFANGGGAFIADLVGGRLEHRFKLDAKYRQTMGRVSPTDLDGASIESYALKPTKFLLPLVDQYRELLKPFKFFLPNGGPYGFADVAEGKVDCYFAPRQPFVDIFSGIHIAEAAGVTVTDFDGRAVACGDDSETLHDVVASGNPALHEKVLEMIAGCRGDRT
jgi:fructose-1,6-bisphosphatase/inositol monophosphatase family enzyme